MKYVGIVAKKKLYGGKDRKKMASLSLQSYPHRQKKMSENVLEI